ncbi:uncharacterized protein CLUP02_02435 [Colletotrichum lupini]|uniref:Uncharacterized protein n=1 Tax=Colletotrichum lupini TaxID=145971 RepID=A0A9Q8SGJ0_9PEZI|nr:uncharacterized protein CLUP02_02435 [Colletotrichum lupini]UQC76969.1 hypothetical protein CLUP02_02435 [Colletotrichum lupini]
MNGRGLITYQITKIQPQNVEGNSKSEVTDTTSSAPLTAEDQPKPNRKSVWRPTRVAPSSKVLGGNMAMTANSPVSASMAGLPHLHIPQTPTSVVSGPPILQPVGGAEAARQRD